MLDVPLPPRTAVPASNTLPVASMPLAVRVVCVVLLIAACVPLRTGGVALSFATQAMVMIVFAQSFQLLLGEAGLLSFGHAAYSGLGAFAAAYALNLAGDLGWPLLTLLLPLVGAFAGALGGATLGWVATRRGGIAFAMITLGTAELLATGAAALPGLSGGEGGISTDRTYGWSPVDLGSPRHIYVLIAIWALVSVIAMRAFTRTPLGLAANAVREQPMRAAFVGFDVRRVRYRMFMVSAAFAGISGALMTLATEHVTSDAFGLSQSGAVLVAVVLGGASGWGGPLLGTLLYVGFAVALATITRAWPFYLGLMFVAVVSLAPGGLIALHRSVRVRPSVRQIAGLLIAGIGLVLGIEMLYRLTIAADSGTTLDWFGVPIDATARMPWLAAAALLFVGVALVMVRSDRDLRRSEHVRARS